MIFAAGFGTRMGDLTKDRPKPLVEVDGQPLINHAIRLLRRGGIERIVVNTHYHAEMLEAHLKSEPDVTTLREEPEILETGGGLRNALPQLGSGPVMTLNSDIIWPGANPIDQLEAAWEPEKMDALLLLLPIENAIGFKGGGDFTLLEDQKIERAKDAPYLYSGLQIIKTNGLSHYSESSFSLTRVWDDMIAANKAFGLVFDGPWVDVGNPAGIALAEKALRGEHV